MNWLVILVFGHGLSVFISSVLSIFLSNKFKLDLESKFWSLTLNLNEVSSLEWYRNENEFEVVNEKGFKVPNWKFLLFSFLIICFVRLIALQYLDFDASQEDLTKSIFLFRPLDYLSTMLFVGLLFTLILRKTQSCFALGFFCLLWSRMSSNAVGWVLHFKEFLHSGIIPCKLISFQLNCDPVLEVYSTWQSVVVLVLINILMFFISLSFIYITLKAAKFLSFLYLWIIEKSLDIVKSVFFSISDYDQGVYSALTILFTFLIDLMLFSIIYFKGFY